MQLQGSGRSAALKQVEHRNLVLERSRGLYEMEMKSNLGTSMTDTVEANLRVRRTEYQLALDFARLEAMLGKPLESNSKFAQSLGIRSIGFSREAAVLTIFKQTNSTVLPDEYNKK